MKKFVFTLLVIISLSFVPLMAQAIPILQLYVEGGSYNSSLETWVISSPNFKLWVIGNISGGGGKGTISDVYLVASGYGSGSIFLTPTITSLVTDPSTPEIPTGPFTSNTVPKSPPQGVTQHSEYSSANDHTFFGLWDFSLNDSPIADFSGPTYPASGDFTASKGQINVYSVSVSGYDEVHFDAYDTVVCGSKSKVVFAPFSHDSTGGVIPEPGTLLLLGAGLVGLVGYGKLRLQRRKK
jgi:hypothetical protein